MQCIALGFYRGLKKEPWFGKAGSKTHAFSACVNYVLQLSLNFWYRVASSFKVRSKIFRTNAEVRISISFLTRWWSKNLSKWSTRLEFSHNETTFQGQTNKQTRKKRLDRDGHFESSKTGVLNLFFSPCASKISKTNPRIPNVSICTAVTCWSLNPSKKGSWAHEKMDPKIGTRRRHNRC